MKALIARLSQELLSVDEVALILGNPLEFPEKMIEDLSIQTAFLYWEGELNFDSSNLIVNNLYNFWVQRFSEEYGFGKIAWESFNAFDAGAYIRKSDSTETCPVEKYTNPLIEALLTKLKIIEKKKSSSFWKNIFQ